MAGLGDVEIKLTDDIAKALQGVSEEIKTTREALSEERIREIVREELAAYEKRQIQKLRFGTPVNYEVK